MKTHYLSKEERERGRQHFLRWSGLNGMGFSFLGDTVVTLMAMHFGATNLQLGYLSSVIHFSGMALLVFPWLLSGANLVNVLYYSWLFRGLVCIFYGVLFWLTGQSAIVTILIIYTAFCVARIFGTVVSSPMHRMLSSASTLGELVVMMSNYFQVSRLLSLFISTIILSMPGLDGIIGYQVLIAIGVLTNTASALELKRVPCRETIEYRQGENVFRALFNAMKDREQALTLFLKWHVLGVMITLSFTLPFLRKFVQLAPNMIFIYTILGTVATIATGYALRPFTDRIGSRPVLMIASFLLAIVSLVWCVLPATLHWSLFFLIGFITTSLQTAISLLVSRLEVRAIPEENKIGYVSMTNFFSALISLASGLFVGFLADLGEQTVIPGLNAFGLAYFCAVILSVQVTILSFFLKDAGSLSVRDVAQLLFSTRNLKAFLEIYELGLADDINTRKSLVLSFSKSDAAFALDEMRHILRDPLSTEKEEVLKSLFTYPKHKLLNDLLREAADESSYHRPIALFALGAYPGKRTERLLLSLLDHPQPTIRSTAAKSLARVGNTSALPKIMQMLADSTQIIGDRMNYLIAVSIMDKQGAYLAQLFEFAAPQQATPSYCQTMFSLTAKMLQMEPPLSTIYQKENIADLDGLTLFFEDARAVRPFLEHGLMLFEAYQQQRYHDLFVWCQTVLAPNAVRPPLSFLQQAILSRNAHDIRREDAIALLYFTYQLLK